MFGQFTEQMKKSSQPASDLFAANVKALEAVSQQQTQFLSGVLDDSVKLLQTMSQQTEVKGLLAAQSVYAESLRERLTSTSKTTYGTMNNVSQQFADALKTGLESAGEASKAAVSKFQTVPVAAAPVKKAEAPKSKPAAKKTAAAKKATPVKKAAPLKADTAKVDTAKTAPVKPVAKVASKKAATKTTAKKAAPNAPVKTAAKPVAKLSAEEVKAAPKAKATPAKSSKVDAATPATAPKSAK